MQAITGVVPPPASLQEGHPPTVPTIKSSRGSHPEEKPKKTPRKVKSALRMKYHLQICTVEDDSLNRLTEDNRVY